MKKLFAFLLVLTLAAALAAGCAPKEKAFDPDADLDTENVFFDDFTSGIDSEHWQVGHKIWGKGNGGVIHDNVGYTADGVAVLASNGDNYAGPKRGINAATGKRTGALLLTRDALGPGRFEVRMKAMPRFGACTAMWTFFYDEATGANHEIDIELNVENDFNVLWETNWVTEQNKDHHSSKTDVISNDGQWHTYKFEWHTNPARIDYYIDDIHTHTSTVYVPTIAGQFNIGNWFPESWSGLPDFETDYMFVDWFRYTPYRNNPYTETPREPASPAQYYPAAPMEPPVANLISNPGFEGQANAWGVGSSKTGIVDGAGANGSKAMRVAAGDIAYQVISGMHEGFELTLEAYVKFPRAQKSGGYILVEFKKLNEDKVGQLVIDLTTDDEGYSDDAFYRKVSSFACPAGTRRIELSVIAGEAGGVTVDDLFLNLTSRLAKA